MTPPQDISSPGGWGRTPPGWGECPLAALERVYTTRTVHIGGLVRIRVIWCHRAIHPKSKPSRLA